MSILFLFSFYLPEGWANLTADGVGWVALKETERTRNTVLFTIAKTWKQPQCPSTDEWIKKMWYECIYMCVCVCVCIHTHYGLLLSHKKE